MEAITKDIILGKLGSAIVLIPSSKTNGLEYNEEQNTYGATLSDGTPYRIEIGKALRVKVTEFSIEGENRMKIICEVEVAVLESIIFGRYQNEKEK